MLVPSGLVGVTTGPAGPVDPADLAGTTDRAGKAGPAGLTDPAAGSRSVKVEPVPSALQTVASPPWPAATC
jgi:hypothetical protein